MKTLKSEASRCFSLGLKACEPAALPPDKIVSAASVPPRGGLFHPENTPDKTDLAFLNTALRVSALFREIVYVHRQA